MSCQCVTLASSPFAQFHQKRCKGLTAFVFTNLVPNLDPSVKHWDDTLLMGQNHNVRTVVCQALE
ncbi:hypothetical protein [Wolbachia endosymbiont (group A) of Beris morrisii]|uniref:hypothetical protein n=1 Tax=Wolbachia endosymbiont (group A) of Beris morrisii TaxID=3066139 RepID=UPI0033414F38